MSRHAPPFVLKTGLSINHDLPGPTRSGHWPAATNPSSWAVKHSQSKYGLDVAAADLEHVARAYPDDPVPIEYLIRAFNGTRRAISTPYTGGYSEAFEWGDRSAQRGGYLGRAV